MAEARVPVQAYWVVLYCDECGARMQATGLVKTSYPPWYPHKCPDCGFEKDYRKQYPYIDYEEE
jgi:predicted RNA-binding Zn-ribbon protein involved in translation (DUF1610 family)